MADKTTVAIAAALAATRRHRRLVDLPISLTIFFHLPPTIDLCTQLARRRARNTTSLT
jgi:hypothetical protein